MDVNFIDMWYDGGMMTKKTRVRTWRYAGSDEGGWSLVSSDGYVASELTDLGQFTLLSPDEEEIACVDAAVYDVCCLESWAEVVLARRDV